MPKRKKPAKKSLIRRIATYVAAVAASVVVAASIAYFVLPGDKVATLGNGVTVTLHSGPCMLPEAKDFLESNIGRPALAATIGVPKELAEQVGVPTKLKACYVVKGDKIAVIDETGRGGFIAADKFK